MTYIAQRDRYRCGPVTVLNALHWAGEDVSYKHDIQRITTMCECAPPKGTKYRPFTKTLRKRGKNLFTIRLLTQPTMIDFDNYLKQGAALAWNFKHSFGRHYALVVGQTDAGKTFKVANWGQDCAPLVNVDRNELKKYVKQHDRLQRVWILTKVDE
jgi:hypothetical protein